MFALYNLDTYQSNVANSRTLQLVYSYPMSARNDNRRVRISAIVNKSRLTGSTFSSLCVTIIMFNKTLSGSNVFATWS